MIIPNSVPVTGFIAPTDSTDTYPVTEPNYGIDGLRSVATVADMNLITTDRRRFGMLVTVNADGAFSKTYILANVALGGVDNVITNNSNFIAFVPSGGAGITTLNTLTAATQTFAIGTGGTDFAISSAVSVHTFNLPIASGVNTGKLSNTDWTTFNSKEPAITTLSALKGGTGFSAYVIGDTLYADTATTLAKLGIGTAGQVLTVVGGIPAWASGGGSGTVTSVSVVTNQGVSGSVATPTTTPAITLTLGALTGVTSLNGLVVTADTGVITTGTWNGTLIGTANGGTGTSTTFTQGSVVFAGVGGVYSQDNANFFWDDTNNRLGIGTVTPSQGLEVSSGTVAAIRISRTGAAGAGSSLYLSSASILNGNDWSIQSTGIGEYGGAGNFAIANDTGGGTAFAIRGDSNNVGIASIGSPIVRLTVAGATSNSAAYALNIINLSQQLLAVRNDGVIAIGVNAPFITGVSLVVQGTGMGSSTYGLQVHDSTGTSNNLIIKDNGESIMTSSTQFPLTLESTAGSGCILTINATTEPGIVFKKAGSQVWKFTNNAPSSDDYDIINASGTTLVKVRQNGFMGIGAGSASVLFNAQLSDATNITSQLYNTGAGTSTFSIVTTSGASIIQFLPSITTAARIISTAALGLKIETTGVDRLFINTVGNFGFNGSDFQDGVFVQFIANATTVPTTNPTGGGILYCEAGALKFRGSSGTVTVIASA